MDAVDSLTEINIKSLCEEEKRKRLKQIRTEIDLIDDSLVELLNYRAKKYEAISTLKQQLNLNNYSPQREKEIIDRISKSDNSKLSSKDLIKIFERIIDVSRAIQKRVRDKN